jgi:ketosteroid isomerase-like protein
METIRPRLAQQAQAWRRRDAVALAAGYAPDAVVSSPMFPRAERRAAIESSFTSLFCTFPDWDITLEEPCIDGNRAMQAGKVRATQRGKPAV